MKSIKPAFKRIWKVDPSLNFKRSKIAQTAKIYNATQLDQGTPPIYILQWCMLAPYSMSHQNPY